MEFVDVRNDIAFRKIFSNENKKEILISFLNAVLDYPEGSKIASVELMNPYQLPIVTNLKATILDVKAKDQSGKEYIVEMQVSEKAGFAKRVTYYSAKSYAAQLNISENYEILKPVIFIGIIDFPFLDSPNYLSRHLILDKETKEHKFLDFDINIIELPKFNKKLDELDNLIDKWIFFIKNSKNLNIIPNNVSDSGLKDAYQEAAKYLWTKKELEAYEYARLREMDAENELKFAKEKGFKQGLERGIEAGIEKGIQQGIEKGIQQGIEKEKIEIAKNAIKQGANNQFIAAITQLNEEQIEQIRNELN